MKNFQDLMVDSDAPTALSQSALPSVLPATCGFGSNFHSNVVTIVEVSENGFLAVRWANDGQRFQAIKTSLLQPSFICGGRSTTATDAPIPLCGTYVASCPGVFSSGIRPRRSSSLDGPISGVQTWRIPKPAGDQEELSVDTPTSSSTVTAVSGSGGEVVGRRSIRVGETRRWRTSTVRINYNDHSLGALAPHAL
ncbi:hypothetical protein EVAR_82487_1 [Eumeta japonica]|uniref:Uncharacterized protein n=1 Tax=Eumeta variegata TaxID=151549 RepID=A0A4C1UWC9_EUMVA|nr:hypothetical protein EVAR_82487_1 [Eumeta japonica]